MHAIPDAGCSACSYPPTVTPNPEPPENDGEKGEDPNLHISIEEMEKDIVDTELEIEALRHDLASAEISRDRLGIMKAETGIKQREEFVEKLKKYLDIRKSK